MQGALAGIRVLDFSTLLPGPMATLFLAEAGAEVIKIERPGSGDDMRHYAPQWGEDGGNFHLLNRGKKSLALDLKDPAALARLTPLIEGADIIVEQFRPGVMARLGLSFDDVRKFKPDVIYCSITGYGQNGPRHLRAGHDLNYQADTGLLALSPGTPEVPVVPPALIADIGGGTYPALVNILMALWRRERTGEGAYIDIAMTDSLFVYMYWAQAQGQVTGNWPGSGDALVTGGSPRYRLYSTADGRFIAAAPLEQKFWDAFCEAIALEEGLRDDGCDPDATAAGVARILRERDAAHWEAIFDAADCCCSVVRTLPEAMASPHIQARALSAARLRNDAGDEMAALPVPIAPALRAPNGVRSAPALGADVGELAGRPA